MKVFLSPFSGRENAMPALKAASLLAKQVGGAVRCLHTLPDPETTGFPYNEVALLAPNDFKGELVRSNQKQLQQTKKSFAAIVEYVGLKETQAEFIHHYGPLDESLIRESRFADVICMHLSGKHPSKEQETALHAALFETGKPVLLLPEEDKKLKDFGVHVAIAWNNSKEAALAVDHALPFLQRAKKVSILSIGDEKKEKDPFEIKRLAEYLSTHEVPKATLHHIKDKKNSAGEALLEGVQECKADMLVMGAFTHHRLRRLVLGGATNYVLENASIPVLMAH